MHFFCKIICIFQKFFVILCAETTNNCQLQLIMDVLSTILSSPRTVFTSQGVTMQVNSRERESISRSLRYYVSQGVILSPRNGIYTKTKYNEEEMACTLLKPSYISLEYVLARSGVTFQYSSEITCISYQTRTIEVDGKSYAFRKINPMIWANMLGIEQRDNIAIASPERAFLDMVYLSAGQCYFDNLRPLNKNLIKQILPTYNSPTLTKRVEALLNGHQ